MSADSRTRTSAVRPKRTDRRLGDVALVSALLVVAALPHGGVFHSLVGYRAALGGVVLGIGLALVAARWRLGPRTAALALAVAYLLGSAPIALPGLSLWGFVPTPESLRAAVLGAVTSWKNLLTIEVPVFSDAMALMPYLTALVCSFLAIRWALLARRGVWALLWVFLLMLSGVFWGSQTAPLAVFVGFGVGLGSWWWAIRTLGARRKAQLATIVQLSAANEPGRLQGRAGAALLIAGAMVAGLASPLLLPDGAPRAVLRDVVDPAVDLRAYASPVVNFRRWHTTDAGVELFTVAGEVTSRLRLATLDTYNGTVFGISGETAESSFKRVGAIFTDAPLDQDATLAAMDVTVTDYRGHWVLGGGQTRALSYLGARARELQDALHYAAGIETILSTTPLTQADAYRVETVVREEVPDSVLQERAIVPVPVPLDSNVPEAVAAKARELTAGASSGLEQVRALQLKLSSQGFYSDGTDGLSRPGHRTDRLEHFLTDEYMVGDDDQFAPAMVLMLRSLGIPARLAMGFELAATESPVRVTGKDVALWVEVPFAGVGWVPFDPTPPEDQTIRTQVPEPRPKPQPQVLQPPVPPEKPAELPPEEVSEVDNPDREDRGTQGWWWLGLQITGGGLGLLSPALLLVAFKAARSLWRRRKGSAEVRTVGAWLELLDRARDLGVRIGGTLPRSSQAEAIDAQVWGRAPGQAFRPPGAPRSPIGELSDAVDEAVFGPSPGTAQQCAEIWDRQREVVRGMRRRLGWRKRLLGALNVVTLRSRWVAPEPHGDGAGGRGKT